VLPGDGYVSEFTGSMTEYLALLDADDAAVDDDAADDADADAADDRAARRAADDARRRRHNAPRDIARLEPVIEAAEAAVADLDAALERAAADATAAAALFADREAAQATVDAHYAEWERLEALLAAPT
jgi:hypothetical protein